MNFSEIKALDESYVIQTYGGCVYDKDSLILISFICDFDFFAVDDNVISDCDCAVF